MTYGAVSNTQVLVSDTLNPASGASSLSKEDSRYGFGVNFGFGYEIGKVDDFLNQLDDTQAELDNQARSLDAALIQQLILDGTIDPNGTPAEIAQDIASYLNSTTIATINEQIALLANKNSYFSAFGSLNVPISIAHKAFGGSITFNAGASAVSNLVAVDDPIVLAGTDIVVGGTSPNYTIDYTIPDSDTSIFIRGAAVMEISLGYSHTVYMSDAGQLFAGLRGNYYKVGLTRYPKRLVDFASDESSEDAFDDYSDDDYEESTGFGVDAGVIWASQHYRVGATLNNINKPSFKYNDVDTSAYSSQSVIDFINSSDTYTMDTQLRLEGAVYTESTNWVLGLAIDANAVEDPLGREYQWASLSAAYATDSWWIPGARVGYRANMAGTKVSSLTAGLTLFKSVSFDMEYSLDSVNVEESDTVPFSGEVPRSFTFNLGLQLLF